MNETENTQQTGTNFESVICLQKERKLQQLFTSTYINIAEYAYTDTSYAVSFTLGPLCMVLFFPSLLFMEHHDIRRCDMIYDMGYSAGNGE